MFYKIKLDEIPQKKYTNNIWSSVISKYLSYKKIVNISKPYFDNISVTLRQPYDKNIFIFLCFLFQLHVFLDFTCFGKKRLIVTFSSENLFINSIFSNPYMRNQK